MGFFTPGETEANRRRTDLGLRAVGELGASAINSQFAGLQKSFSPILSQMAQGAAIGANMETQALQANLARQGLGGTGLGSALGSGMRSGATFQTNILRSKLLSELFGKAVGTQTQRAGAFLNTAGLIKKEASGFQQTVGALGVAGNLLGSAGSLGLFDGLSGLFGGGTPDFEANMRRGHGG